MKKLIFFLIMLMAVSAGAETAKYGSMWKQNDGTVSPADDIEVVDFSNISTIGIGDGDGGGVNGAFVSYTTVSGVTYANVTTAMVAEDITAYDIMLQGVFGSGTSIDISGAGTRMFFYPKKAAFRSGAVTSTHWDNSLIGNYSFATGRDSTAKGVYSHTEGYLTFAESTAEAGHAEGYNTQVTGGRGAHAEGKDTTATTNGAHAEGQDTTASGSSSHAEGDASIASAPAAHAEGKNTTASGNPGSHAEGSFTTASAGSSHVGGTYSVAAGIASFVHGSYIKSTAADSVMFGSYADATERDANPLTTANTMMLANMDLVVDGFIDGNISKGFLSDDNEGLGTQYNVYTTFMTYTSYGAIGSSSNVTASASAGTITLDSGVEGEFMFRVDASVTGVGGPELIYTVFRNDTTELMSFARPIGGVHHHPPTMTNLSTNAAYDTYSSLENLFYADGTEVWIDEASSGADPLVYDVTFNGGVLYPTIVEFINVLYDGGAAHEVEALMKNYSTGAWVNMRTAAADFPDAGGADAFRYYNREFATPLPISSYVNTSTRESMVRVLHTSTGSPGDEFKVDKIQLHDAHNTSALSFGHVVDLVAGDTISLKIKSNIDAPIYVKNLHLHLHKQ